MEFGAILARKFWSEIVILFVKTASVSFFVWLIILDHLHEQFFTNKFAPSIQMVSLRPFNIHTPPISPTFVLKWLSSLLMSSHYSVNGQWKMNASNRSRSVRTLVIVLRILFSFSMIPSSMPYIKNRATAARNSIIPNTNTIRVEKLLLLSNSHANSKMHILLLTSASSICWVLVES